MNLGVKNYDSEADHQNLETNSNLCALLTC